MNATSLRKPRQTLATQLLQTSNHVLISPSVFYRCFIGAQRFRFVFFAYIRPRRHRHSSSQCGHYIQIRRSTPKIHNPPPRIIPKLQLSSMEVVRCILQLVDNIRAQITRDAGYFVQELRRSFKFSFGTHADRVEPRVPLVCIVSYDVQTCCFVCKP